MISAVKEKEIINAILACVESNKSQILKLDEIYKIFSDCYEESKNDVMVLWYEDVLKVINSLVDNKVLKPYGKDTNNKGVKSLFKRYKVVQVDKREKKVLSENDKLFLYSLNENINTDHYFKNYNSYVQDKENLKKLNDFLNSLRDDTCFMGINERSYMLFGYEKFLMKDRIMNRVKMNFEQLNCYYSYTPLQAYMTRGYYEKESRKILIVENLDTYWSFHRAMCCTKLGNVIDMLIYGGGGKISGNFKFHPFYKISEKDDIKYLGDIDAEGLRIYKSVKEKCSNLSITLEESLYGIALDIGEGIGIRDLNNMNQVNIDNELEVILAEVNDDIASKIINIIRERKYIPQEAVNYEVIINRLDYICKNFAKGN